MKAFIKKIITNGYGLTDYVPVGIDQIKEKSLLQIGEGSTIEVTERQFTLAYNPLVIGIVMSHQLYKTIHDEQCIVKLFFVGTGTTRKISELYLKYYKIPDAWSMDHEYPSFVPCAAR